MKVNLSLEVGNWEEAAKVIQAREPHKFTDFDVAKDFLKKKVLEEYEHVTVEDINRNGGPEFAYGPILGLPLYWNEKTPAGIVDVIGVRFWLSLKTDDRSNVRIN